MRILITFLILCIAYGAEAKGWIFGSVREADTGKEISGVSVKLLLVNQHCPEKEVLTSERGEFLFDDLAPGRYRVLATKDGYVRTIFGEDQENPVGQELLITELTIQQEIDFHLAPGAAISGHIYDADGNPIARSPVIFKSAVRDSVFQTLTDDLGYYYAGDLPPDVYKISSRKWNSLNRIEGERWFYPGVLDESQLAVIELQAGKTSIADIRFGTVPTPAWTGRVFGPDREPIPDADFGMLRVDHSKLVPSPGCRTRQDGACSLRTIAPGTYWVYLLKVPSPYVIWRKKEAPENSPEEFGLQLIVEEEKESITEFQLENGRPLQAKIYMQNGSPAATETGITVTLNHFWKIPPYNLPLQTSMSRPSSDSLEFYVDPSLSYELQVSQNNPQSTHTVVKIEWNRLPLTNPIQISQSSDELNIWVDQGASISGVAPGAKIIFAERIGKEKDDALYSPSLFHATVQQGNFLMRALPPGTYRVRQNQKNGPFIEVTIAAGESRAVHFQ